ncbi:hypothetical protein YC2023_013350 [Brassica napus]
MWFSLLRASLSEDLIRSFGRRIRGRQNHFAKNKIIDSSSSSSGASLLHHELPHDRHPRRGTQREVLDGLSTATATVF